MQLKRKEILIISMLIIGSFAIPKFTYRAKADVALTIYTYESLLADPGYDFVGNFSAYAGVDRNSIKLVLLPDANSIVSKAALEKDNPEADVLIGIDNVLIHKAKEEEILEPYESPELANISTDLITNLDSQYYVLPYDYGIISLWYDSHRINESTLPQINSLTLDQLLSLGMTKKLVVEDPTLSSTGLGFLLWTIAVYGDPKINFDGLLCKDWHDWWRQAAPDLRIAPSWGAAFDIWYETSENRPIMISYGTSPAYGACLYNDTSAKAVLTHEKNKANAWLQIEGIGLVKNAHHKELAKKFIDWFLSKDLQDHIACNNWMYPANIYAEVPPCFAKAAIDPSTVNILNNILTPEMIKANLDQWLDDWESAIATEKASFVNIMIVSLALFTVGAMTILLKKNKKIKTRRA